MRKLLLLTAVLFLSGCSTSIQTAAIAPDLNLVLSKHDAYVQADPALSTAAKAAALAQSTFLRGEMVNTSVAANAIAPDLNAVAGRYNTYITADPTLDAFHKNLDLRDTQLLRAVLSAAGATTQP